MRKRSLGIAAAIAAAIAMGAGIAPAQAEPGGNAVIEIKSVAKGQCLQPPATPTRPRWELGDCTGAANQQWEQLSVSGGFVLRNVADRRCVVGWGGLAPYKCDGENVDQVATFEPDGTGAVKLKYPDGYADTIIYSSHAVILRAAAEGDHQRWQVRQVGVIQPPDNDTTGKVVRLRSDQHDVCLAARVGIADLVPCTGVQEQNFQRVELGDGRFQLRNAATGLCLNNRRGSAVDVRGDCAPDNLAQQWRLEDAPLGLFRIKHSTGRYLLPFEDGSPLLGDTTTSWHKWEVTAR